MERTHEGDDRHATAWDDHYKPLRGARLLIVEDEVIIAMELQSTFEDQGADVIGPAYTLAAGVELAVHDDISAAVLDLRLGRDAVSPVARALAARNIPFLFYTGQPPSDPILAEWPEVTAIAKPASVSRLVDAVTRLLEQNDLRARRAM